MPALRFPVRRSRLLLICAAVASLTLIGATAAQAAPASARSMSIVWNSGLPVPSGVTNDPADFQTPELAAMSCPGAGVCDIAENGQLAADNSQVAYLIRRTAGSTTTVMIPGSGVNVEAMDCPRVDHCIATGVGGLGGDAWLPFAAVIDGSSVTVATLPASAANQLTAIDCADTNHCLAVGEGAAYRLDGTAWSAVTLPADFHGAAVKCLSANRCEIAGSVDFSSAAIAEVRGARVSVTTVASTAQLPAFSNVVSARIDCAATGECVAVWRGWPADPNSSSWVGTAGILQHGTWRIAALPAPKDLASGSAVAPGAVSCTAVGCVVASTYQTSGGISDVTFATELLGRWLGATPAHTANSRTIGGAGPNDAGPAAAEAACDRIGECSFPVQSASAAAVATVSGTSIRMASVPAPAGALAALIRGLGCPDPSRCLAIADTVDGWA